jgi:antitoxin PrlF
LGIEPGGAVIVEECAGELRLKPAAVLEVELYSDDQIAEWDQADGLSEK